MTYFLFQINMKSQIKGFCIFMTNFQRIFFYQKFKDTNMHLAMVQERKRTNKLFLNYIHMFQL